MAGRPQRRPTPASRKGRAPHPVAPPAEPLTRQATAAPVGILRAGDGRAVVQARPRAVKPVEDAYRAALEIELDPHTAIDPEATRTAYLGHMARGGKVTGAHAVAASLLSGVLQRGRIAVAAAKEMADRTEGPVVQRVESLSARFVVSVGPTGVLESGHLVGSPSSPEDWEAAVRADLGAREAEARLAAPASAGGGEPASDNASFVKSVMGRK